MTENKYNTTATFTSLNGTEICYGLLMEAAKRRVEYAVNCGYLSREDGDDAMQDSAIKILRSSHGYDERKSPIGTWYASRVADNCCRNLKASWHSGAVDNFSAHEMLDKDEELWMDPEVDAYRADEFNPERDLESAENVRYILDTLGTLRGKDRLVAEMLINNAKPEAIGDALGCSADAASVRVHRVRRALAPALHGLLDEFGISGKATRYGRCRV